MLEKTHGQKWSILCFWEQFCASGSGFEALAGWLAVAGWPAVTAWLAGHGCLAAWLAARLWLDWKSLKFDRFFNKNAPSHPPGPPKRIVFLAYVGPCWNHDFQKAWNAIGFWTKMLRHTHPALQKILYFLYSLKLFEITMKPWTQTSLKFHCVFQPKCFVTPTPVFKKYYNSCVILTILKSSWIRSQQRAALRAADPPQRVLIHTIKGRRI